MPKRELTCDDCYFRLNGLCALAGDRICPTFRAAEAVLSPPTQAPLVPRPLTPAASAA